MCNKKGYSSDAIVNWIHGSLIKTSDVLLRSYRWSINGEIGVAMGLVDYERHAYSIVFFLEEHSLELLQNIPTAIGNPLQF